jgi:hypothetical protein
MKAANKAIHEITTVIRKLAGPLAKLTKAKKKKRAKHPFKYYEHHGRGK